MKRVSIIRPLRITWALVRFYVRMLPGDWYYRAPFLPIPPKNYLQWRFHTAYGAQRPSWMHVIRDVWQVGDWLHRYPHYRR